MTELKLHVDVKLGKTPPTYDHRDLLFGEFVKAGITLRDAPVGFGHDKDISDWKMLGNDQYGDCVWAGAAHETFMLNQVAGRSAIFTADTVLSDYSACTGFNRNDPNTDGGTDMHTAMNYRRKTGIIDSAGNRHKIGGYVSLEPGNWNEHLQALYVFDCVGIGIEFPDYAMNEFNANKPWTVRPGGTIEGGHYIPIVARPTTYYLDIVTWGRTQRMSRGFFHKYNDESYGFFTVESMTNGRTAEGFDLAGLQEAIREL